MAYTVAEAVTRLRARLDEVTPAQWTDVQLRTWLNEGARDMARRTFHFTDVINENTTAGDGEYIISADVLRINHAYWNPADDASNQIPLQARQWEAMDNIWWNRQNQESGYPVVYTTYGFSPNLTVKLFPIPSVNGVLTFHVARLPADLDITTGTGNIEVPEAWFEVVLDYAEYMALRKDRDPRWQESFTLYNARIDDLIANGNYLNAPGEFVFSGRSILPRWLVEPGW